MGYSEGLALGAGAAGGRHVEQLHGSLESSLKRFRVNESPLEIEFQQLPRIKYPASPGNQVNNQIQHSLSLFLFWSEVLGGPLMSEGWPFLQGQELEEVPHSWRAH